MNWGTINNQGEIRPAQVSVATNGSLNKLIFPSNYGELFNVSSWKDKGEITGLGFIYKKAVKGTGFDLMMGVQTAESAVYDGTAQLFDVVVLYDGTDVVGTNDYTVTYLDPTGATITADRIVDAGTYQVAIKGRNAFKGSVTKQFTVTPAEITEAELSAYELRYTGAEQKPTVSSVKSGNATLATTDYTVAYSSETAKDVGTYEVTVTGTGNYEGSKQLAFTIEPAALDTVNVSETSFAYDGNVHKPTIKPVCAGDLALSEADYTVEYSDENPKDVGTYALTVTAKGNFAGSRSVTFKFFGDLPAAPTGTGWRDLEGGGKGYAKDGSWVIGWFELNSAKYYFDNDARMYTGWSDINVGDKTMRYYFRPSGSMATGWVTIDGQKYWFRPSGNMATGFADVDDEYKRYFDGEGHMVTGWQEINGKTYYFRIPSGAMQTGAATIDGKECTFSNNGVLQTSA